MSNISTPERPIPAALPTHALRFEDEPNRRRALGVIEELLRDRSFDCDRIPTPQRPSVILPEDSYYRLVDALRQRGIDYREVVAVPVSGLPVEEQRKIRNRNRPTR